jgi:hypothetical protein
MKTAKKLRKKAIEIKERLDEYKENPLLKDRDFTRFEDYIDELKVEAAEKIGKKP